MSQIINPDLTKYFSKELIALYNQASHEDNQKLSDTDRERIYQTIIEKEPLFLPAYNNLGELLIRSKRNSEAIEILKQGMKVAQRTDNGSTTKIAIFGVAVIWLFKLNMAIALDEKEDNYHTWISRILAEWPMQDKTIADQITKTGLAQGSYLLGRSLYFLGKYKEALPYLEFSYKELSQPERIQEMLADVYYQTENFQKSSELYNKFINSKSDFNLRQRHGMALLRNGEFQRAEKLFTSLLDEFLDKSGRRKEYETLIKEINAKKNQTKREEVEKKILETEKSSLPVETKDRELGFLYILKGEYNKAVQLLSRTAEKLKMKRPPK